MTVDNYNDCLCGLLFSFMECVCVCVPFKDKKYFDKPRVVKTFWYISSVFLSMVFILQSRTFLFYLEWVMNVKSFVLCAPYRYPAVLIYLEHMGLPLELH